MPNKDPVKRKAWEKRHRIEKAKEINEYHKAWEKRNPEKRRRYRQNWERNNPDKLFAKRLRNTYGVSITQYSALLEKQDGRCAICFLPDAKRLVVDHDHRCCAGAKSCGKCVRGLLCNHCNWALGHITDSVPRMRSMIDYIKRSRG